MDKEYEKRQKLFQNWLNELKIGVDEMSKRIAEDVYQKMKEHAKMNTKA